MNFTNRILPLGVIIGGLVYAMFAIAATVTDTDCTDAWADAPAKSYCAAEGAMATSDAEKCIVGASSCSITVDITESGETESVTFNPTFPRAWTLDTGGISLPDTDDIDICFATASNEITAAVKIGCDTNEVTSATATTSAFNLDG